MGNDEVVSSYSYNTSSTFAGSPDVNRNSKHSSSLSSRWPLALSYGIVLVSWFSAFRCNGNLSELSNSLNSELGALTRQREETLSLLKTAQNDKDRVLRQHKKLKRTSHLFEHEARMKEELFELHQTSDRNDTLKVLESRQSGIAMTWVQQRQEALFHKIYSLQEFIKSESRRRVINKYGPGQHIVEFTVKAHNGQKEGTFQVELAPLDLLPHAVETFLDMATNKLWDNTVFYHHKSQHHVIAAAPVNYGTFETKHYHFDALGYTGVSFPEYHNGFPHKEYTLGFSGRGPNFYINTLDNSNHHGPGGQGHHDLPSDADPCFGKIIDGESIIKDMMPGSHSSGDNPVSWHDFDLTQIVKIELLEKNNKRKSKNRRNKKSNRRTT